MKKHLKFIRLAALAISLMITGCSSSANETEEQTTETALQSEQTAETDEQADIAAQYEVTELPQLDGVQSGDTIATIKTNYGDIKVWFFPEYAPKAVENFTTHAKDGYYDNLIFHRVINDFMIQGGDPLGTGAGGESIWGADFENEVTPNLRSFRGALCMANAGADTNGSQFYIVQAEDAKSTINMLKQQADEETFNILYPENVVSAYEEKGGYPSLDFGYTIFGQVYDGMDVVDKIAAVQTDESDKPVEDVIIESIEVGTY